MNILVKMQDQKIVETTARFPFDNKIETMERFVNMHGEKCFEASDRFSISKRD